MSVVSQAEPVADAPVVSTLEIPPLPNPLASDMAKRNFWFSGNDSWVENEPIWDSTSYAEDGTDMFKKFLNSCFVQTKSAPNLIR